MATEAKPRERRRGLSISAPQVLVIVGLIIGLSVIIDFNRRIQAEQRIVAEANQLRAEVTALAATQSALATEVAFASSDAYVAQWAHGEGRYVQPGEVLVVPVAPSGAASIPAPTVTAEPEPPSNFQIWWSLFFESAPGS
jgi:cell division protein FtsB